MKNNDKQSSADNRAKGRITKIQRLAIHDGPGIRTLVFLKGCPLRCAWCSSPETQSSEPEILEYPERCLSCGECAKVCSVGAVRRTSKGRLSIDRSRCTRCGDCAGVCYAEALRCVGEERTVTEILGEAERDRVFYDHSGGGITVSGGEPLQQHEFTARLLRACKEAGLHTAMETCGMAAWEEFEKVIPFVDLLLYDLKLMDPSSHRRWTGSRNDVILNNLRKALEKGIPTVVRYPVIMGINCTDDNVSEMCRFLRATSPVLRVDLLPYHSMGEVTYGRMGRRFRLKGPEVAPEEMERLLSIVVHAGIPAKIGG